MKVGDTVVVKLPGPTRNSMYDHNVKIIYENDLGMFYGTTKSFSAEMIVELWQTSSVTNMGHWVGEVDELRIILDIISTKGAPQA